MPVDPLDKPIAKLREETIDRLTLNYSHGELSFEAFKRRLDQALHKEWVKPRTHYFPGNC